MGAEAVANALLVSSLYTRHFKDHMAKWPPGILKARWENIAGLLCYVQPKHGVLEAPRGDAYFKAAGPCVIIKADATSCTVCLVRIALHPYDTV